MPAYLLTWNPKQTDWDAYEEDRAEVIREGFLDGNWSCGRNKRIKEGDRVFLLRQGLEPKGIIATGYAQSSTYPKTRWNDKTRRSNYIDVRWDKMLDFESGEILSRGRLSAIGGVHWDTQVSGISIPDDVARILDSELGGSSQSEIHFPEEIQPAETFPEGAVEKVTVNRYERDPRARAACIKHYSQNGTIKCIVCNFDFSDFYGELGKNFIHVHHIFPMAKIKKTYSVDPVKDLRPVCANCHAMIHRDPSAPLSVDALKRRLQSNRQPPLRTRPPRRLVFPTP